MERKRHEKITKKMIKQLYIFTHWDYCKDCKHVQHYEEFKLKIEL